MENASILWLTVDRHPESLKALIRVELEAKGWNVDEVSYENLPELDMLDLENVKGVLLAPAREIPKRYLRRLSNCSLIQIWSSGYDKFNIKEARSAGLRIANNHGANATSVAEHTFLLMLGVSRRAVEMHRRVVEGAWAGNDHGMNSYSLNDKTLGIVGMGRIGSLVAERAVAFGMEVIYSDPRVEESYAPTGSRRVSWTDLLACSDYISLHVHHNHETHGMLDSQAFKLMQKQPFIINPSRAELIDQQALLGALSDGTIRGLGIDAHYSEPTDAGDSMWKNTSVFASPHVAGSTIDSYKETISACIANLERSMSGEVPFGIIEA